MNHRDLELLDKQMGHISPAPASNGVLMLAITAVFFADIAFGGYLSSFRNAPPLRTASVAAPALPLTRPTLTR
jgi:hypothetical protein